ncbi:N-acetylmuramoyl-L-alanine amidase LytC precursor [Desulfosporosinus acididurans]|uniref:N-acetylmuramoyl-L-alanine amidase LytC n=1 Tax=Desulfosporosinus acididurans TaxID=476652 RepID=A0A0J1FSW1_9FIRM|nr:cell wall-binding repeat-containing protein [Desulfosporosinus acididurans]KLU66048.1 N-acetylmuramoyl-L-alanine amidase LytC precursor [Desulfosporosinus acididurans]
MKRNGFLKLIFKKKWLFLLLTFIIITSTLVVDVKRVSAATVVPVGNYPCSVAVNTVTNKIYVANYESNSIMVIDGTTNTIDKAISVGNTPCSVAVNTVTNKIYVANPGSNSITVIDGATNTTGTAISLGNSPSAVAVNTVTNKIYVASGLSNSITVIDGVTNTIGTSISLGDSPSSVSVNTVTNKIYVANLGSNSITVIDGATNTIGIAISLGDSPSSVAVNPATNKIYVANVTSNSITVIDGATNTIGGTISVGTLPIAVATDSVTNKIFVTNIASNNVTVIDGATNTTYGTIFAGNMPYAVAVNPDTNKIYVANASSNSITVIDGATNPNGCTAISVGMPGAVAANSVTNKIYVTNPRSNAVTVIDGATNSTGTAISVGNNPCSVAVNSATNKIYVANYNSNNVTVIDGSNNATSGTIFVGNNPSAVAVNSVTNKIYVTNAGTNSITVIDGVTNTIGATISLGRNPLAVAVNSVTNKIYVTCPDSHNVMVIDGSTNSIDSNTSVDSIPCAVAVNSVNNKVYVANAGSNSIRVIDGATNATDTYISVGGYPIGVDVDTVTNKIYVANLQSNSVTVINEPSPTGVILGIVTDGTNPVAAVNVSLTVNGSVYSAVTGADGVYCIQNVPIGTGYTITASKTGYNNGSTTANVTEDTTTLGVNITLNNTTSGGGRSTPSGGGTTTVTGSVIDDNGIQVSNVTATVTEDSNGNYTVSMNAAQAVTLQQPNGTMSPLNDLSKVTFVSAAGSSVRVSADGTINLTNLAKGTDNNFNITYDLGNGQTITIGAMEVKISSSGATSVTCTLIDPYGIIIDAATGKPIAGVNVTLYYADTDRNKANGETPDTVVPLPNIDGFKPNNNMNPQISDASGSYGFMVFPTTDYYIVATKDGYNNYTSPTISVEQDIVKWDFKMNQTTSGVTRLAGQSRVDTALAIAKANYTGKLSNVILATADNYPDALAGSVLAYKLNAPILLVGSSDTDQEKVLDYMKSNLDPAGGVYILGGTAVVSSSMEGKVTASGFANITRLGGTDRYETSAKIADKLKVKTGTPLVIAYGENYPDALTISSIAAEMQYPILLVQKNGLSDVVKNEIAAIKPSKVYIIGGERVISADVESQVAQMASIEKSNIVRIAGTDRYETSLAVAQYFNLLTGNVCIATGNNFPDALAGSVYAANHDAPIILADGNLSDQVINYLKATKLTGATLFGGEAVVSKDIEQQLGHLIGH